MEEWLKDWIKLAEWMVHDTREETPHFQTKHLVAHILKGQIAMALNLSNLQASVAALVPAVAGLAAAEAAQDATLQPIVDKLTADVQAATKAATDATPVGQPAA